MGLSEGRFPSYRSAATDEGLEEERRLFYVAVTRAKNEVALVYPMLARDRYGVDVILEPSRFLAELPDGVSSAGPSRWSRPGRGAGRRRRPGQLNIGTLVTRLRPRVCDNLRSAGGARLERRPLLRDLPRGAGVAPAGRHDVRGQRHDGHVHAAGEDAPAAAVRTLPAGPRSLQRGPREARLRRAAARPRGAGVHRRRDAGDRVPRLLAGRLPQHRGFAPPRQGRAATRCATARTTGSSTCARPAAPT